MCPHDRADPGRRGCLGRGDRRRIPAFRAFQETCTPSYYNQEGRETPATALNDIYGAGAHVFFKILEDWRAEDKLNGLEVTH